MLKAMCSSPKWTNALVTSRQYSPFATALPSSASLRPSDVSWPFDGVKPAASRFVTRNTATLIASSARVTHGSFGSVKPALRTSGRRPAHSGQRMPTAACVMHSAQIGRPQLEQARPVSRPGWR